MPIEINEYLPPNLGVYIENDDGRRTIGIVDNEYKVIRNLKGKKAPNKDLQLLYDAFQNKNITMIAIDGFVGTGKTSSVVKEAIDKWIKKEKKVYISKPHVFTENYGFLPGDIDEKLDPTLKNYSQWFNRYTNEQYEVSAYQHYKEQDLLEIQPLAYIRGCDIPDAMLVVDECQNAIELQSIATRRAKNSLFVFIGDTSGFQFDNKKCTPNNNGFTKLIKLLDGADYFQYIELKTLEHILRSNEVRDIMRRYLKLKEEN